MNKIFLYLSLIFCLLSTSYAQAPEELTDAVIKRITREVDSEAKELMKKLNSMKEDSNYIDINIEFTVDTFRIERYLEKVMDIDYSTSGMSRAVIEATSKYDLLLNKYYQYLIKQLLPKDKEKLREAQRAWVNFRDKESDLHRLLRDEHYSGGGTIQGNILVGKNHGLVKQRAIELYHYCIDILQP